MTDSFKPGLYYDVPENDYHSRRFGPPESLSSTEASSVLKAPALFHWDRTHARKPNGAFDFGHLVHTLVLGTGLDIHLLDYDNLRTRKAQAEAAEARARGELPVLAADYDTALHAAQMVLDHPVAGEFFCEGEGRHSEVSAYAQDEETGAWLRGRFDRLIDHGGEHVIVDLKTARSADPDVFTGSVMKYGYDLQMEWYRALYSMTQHRPVGFTHVVVEKEPPHLVSVIELDTDFEEIGRIKRQKAIRTYAECVRNGTWPGYPPLTHFIDAPQWYADKWLDDIKVA